MLAAQAGIRVQNDLLTRLDQARAQTDQLFDIVKPEFLYERPIPERHRILFYIGHLEAFEWNLLRERVLGITSFHPEFDQLFAFGSILSMEDYRQINQRTGLPSARCAIMCAKFATF